MIKTRKAVLPSSTLRWRVLEILLLLPLSPITAVCSTEEVPGLDILNITFPLILSCSSAKNPSPPVHLDELLSRCKLHGTHVHYNVVVSCGEQNSDSQESNSELTNTDIESIEGGQVENEQSVQTALTHFALNSLPHENDSKRDYLLQKNEINADKNKFTDHLCKKLAKDALQIAHAHPNAFTRSVTTCFCVVLRDKNGHAKKFVFHNGKDKMSNTMEQKAQELKYAIRTGYQAHAEAEFIQFLLQRMEQNPERYTHILGMGCSRQHCKECDCLMKLFLGTNYHGFTAAMCLEDPALPKFTDVEDRCCICTRTYHNPLHKSDAVNKGGRRSDKYYLPRLLQEYIQNKVGLNIDFSNDRFVLKNERAMTRRRNKKRKTSTASLGYTE